MQELEKIIESLKGRVVPGVYLITSPTGRKYAGSAKNIRNRFMQYRSLSCKGQTKLYASFCKHGVFNHHFEILEEVYNEDLDVLDEQLNEKEIYWGTLHDVTSANNLTLRLGKRNGKTSQTTKDKIGEAHAEPILQYTIEGEFVKEWKSASEVGRFFNIDPSNVSGCCTGRAVSVKGFLWRHKNLDKWRPPVYINKNFDTKKHQDIGNKNKIPIIQYDLLGNVIKYWDSASDASKQLNIRLTGINSVLYKVNKMSGGFMWGYVGDEVPTYSKYDFTLCKSKRVLQYSNKMEFIKEWYSLTQAAAELKLSSGDISYCCRGIKCKTVGGFIWKYSNNINEKPPKRELKGGSKKSVLQYTTDGIFLKEWSSLKEASEGINKKSSTGILSCCKGINKTSGGFIWKYKKDVLPL